MTELALCDEVRAIRPTRKVWNDSFRSMLTLRDGEEQPLAVEPQQVVPR